MDFSFNIHINLWEVIKFLGKGLLNLGCLAVCIFIAYVGIAIIANATHSYEKGMRIVGGVIIAAAFILHLAASHWVHM